MPEYRHNAVFFFILWESLNPFYFDKLNKLEYFSKSNNIYIEDAYSIHAVWSPQQYGNQSLRRDPRNKPIISFILRTHYESDLLKAWTHQDGKHIYKSKSFVLMYEISSYKIVPHAMKLLY